MPHAPQFAGLWVRSTQVSPQRTWLDTGQSVMPVPGVQRFATQTMPLGQAGEPLSQNSRSVREHPASSAISARHNLRDGFMRTSGTERSASSRALYGLLALNAIHAF